MFLSLNFSSVSVKSFCSIIRPALSSGLPVHRTDRAVQRLRSVALGFFGAIMDFDVDAVGTGGHAGHRAGGNQIGSAGRVGRVNDDR